MGLPIFQEKRLSTRKKLTGLLPGRLRTSDNVDIKCTPRDVSEHGIGIIADVQLPKETKLSLKIKDKEIPLEISWSQPGFGKSDQIRYGLVCPDESVNLEQIFLEAGCLK